MRLFIVLVGCLTVLLLAAPHAARAAQDRHIGYYYPKPAAIEEYVSRARTLPQTSRRNRIGFVVGIVDQILKRPFPPPAAVFVKGKFAEKMIIVATTPGRLDTIYRVRAYLATLTSAARAMPVFAEHQVQDIYTFLDLLKLLGFKQLTLSDGDSFAHQVIIK